MDEGPYLFIKLSCKALRSVVRSVPASEDCKYVRTTLQQYVHTLKSPTQRNNTHYQQFKINKRLLIIRNSWEWIRTKLIHTCASKYFSRNLLIATLRTKYLSTNTTMVSPSESGKFFTALVTFFTDRIGHPILLQFCITISL